VTGPILLIGAGRMGGALLKGWMGKGFGPVCVIEPKPAPELRKLAKAGSIRLHANIEDVSADLRVCVIALKPQILKREAARLRSTAEAGTLMISIAAGIDTKFLAGAWGHKARLIRAMPNTPGVIGRGISALYASPRATAADRKLAQELLSALGETLWVRREPLIDAVTAVSGSGPAYVFLLAEALAEAAKTEGLPRDAAERLARATVIGSGALLDADPRAAADLRRDVTSPGGTTAAALEILMAGDGLEPLIARAVQAARKRAKELGS
jgi:pyrroline-5-carboxylate reductase